MGRLKLEPEVAVAKIKAGESVLLPLRRVIELLGDEGGQELYRSLQTGEVQAFSINGQMTAADVDEFMVRSDDLISWMARHRRHFV